MHIYALSFVRFYAFYFNGNVDIFAYLHTFKAFCQILISSLYGNQIKKLITTYLLLLRSIGYDRYAMSNNTDLYLASDITMARLSNCIYRAYSSSKFIMKSLLRFLP